MVVTAAGRMCHDNTPHDNTDGREHWNHVGEVEVEWRSHETREVNSLLWHSGQSGALYRATAMDSTITTSRQSDSILTSIWTLNNVSYTTLIKTNQSERKYIPIFNYELSSQFYVAWFYLISRGCNAYLQHKCVSFIASIARADDTHLTLDCYSCFMFYSPYLFIH